MAARFEEDEGEHTTWSGLKGGLPKVRVMKLSQVFGIRLGCDEHTKTHCHRSSCTTVRYLLAMDDTAKCEFIPKPERLLLLVTILSRHFRKSHDLHDVSGSQLLSGVS